MGNVEVDFDEGAPPLHLQDRAFYTLPQVQTEQGLRYIPFNSFDLRHFATALPPHPFLKRRKVIPRFV